MGLARVSRRVMDEIARRGPWVRGDWRFEVVDGTLVVTES